jgi:hypothetical protein
MTEKILLLRSGGGVENYRNCQDFIFNVNRLFKLGNDFAIPPLVETLFSSTSNATVRKTRNLDLFAVLGYSV